MKTRPSGREHGLVWKMPLLTKKDAAEYSRIRKELVEALQKIGGYVPALDDFLIDEIVRAAVYEKKVELYMDSGNASLDTYHRAAETKLIFSKIIEHAIQQLAIARRDRIGKQTESALMNELREAILRGMNASGEQ